jgi:hypothetical protein
LIRKVLLFAAASAFTFSAAVAVAQDVPVSPLDKQLSRIDLAVQGVGMFNKSVQGTVPPTAAQEAGPTVSDAPSNTLGALVTLRYVAKPYVGFEGNYGYARYTENFSNIGGVQTQANEYTLGYLATPGFTIFDFQPYVSVGAGSIGFRPTPRGGQGLTIQARAAYYYSAGIQKEYFSEHFGFRAGFRQLFFLAPDYGQNYLTIKQRTITSEPTFGFYLKF